MGITNYGLELMGYKRLPEGESISGVFNKMYTFVVEGLQIDETTLTPRKGVINGQAYQIGFGAKLNSISRELTDDDFVDDEDQWTNEKKVKGPFAIIHLGPTGLHANTSPYFMEIDGMLSTHDSFQPARQELKIMEAKVVPPLLAALESAFSATGHPVRFRPLETAFFGTSTSGKTIHDNIISFNARAYVSRKLSTDDFDSTLDNAFAIAANLNSKVANFMHLGFQEKDRLKKFLNFFLAIEIQTHATFKKIDHRKFLESLVAVPSDDIKDTVNTLLLTQHQKLSSLKDHFIWCVICEWRHLTDVDVKTFNDLKKIRDDIAHGNISILPAGAESDAEKFIIKIQTGDLRAPVINAI